MAIDVTIPANNVRASKAAMRANWAEINGRIGSLPAVYASLKGKILSILQDETGPGAPDGAVDFNSQPVMNFTFKEVTVAASETVDGSGSTNSRNGKLLKCVTSSTITLTFLKTGSPVVGAGFYCQLWNAGSGTLQISLGSGFTNSNPSGHTQVQPGRKAELYVAANGTTVFFDGATQ